MVQSCCAYNCTARFKKGQISFYRFPSDKELVKKWIVALKRKNFTPTPATRICGKHFEEDCFEPMKWTKYKKLKETAIPTIFDFPAGYIKNKKPRKPPKNRSNDLNLEEARLSIGPIKSAEKVPEKILGSILGVQTSIIEPTTIFVEKVVDEICRTNNLILEKAKIEPKIIINTKKVADKSSTTRAEPACPNCVTLERTTEALNKAQSKLRDNRKKMKMLQQKCRRQACKINKYKSLIKHWQKKNLVDEEISELLQDYIPEGGEIVLKINVPNIQNT